MCQFSAYATVDFAASKAAPIVVGPAGPKASGKAKSIGAAVLKRIKGAFDLSARLQDRREARADALRGLGRANDSTEFIHRQFERSRIEKLLPEWPEPEESEEAMWAKTMEQVGLWVVTGRYWAQGTYKEPPKVRFATNLTGDEEEGHLFAPPRLLSTGGRVDSGASIDKH
ncbi:hypothetical protein MMC16_007585 [Acarospora aff. strigata]|nr:hypothetical protein [Acarospora aff. strigata]